MERTERIEEEIKKIVSKVIGQELHDPRLTGMISVTKVSVTGDLKYCKVFISMLGTKDENEAMDALKSASGYVRREIGNNVRMHSTPEVKFVFDDSMEYGDKIQKIISGLDIKPIEDEENNETEDNID